MRQLADFASEMMIKEKGDIKGLRKGEVPSVSLYPLLYVVGGSAQTKGTTDSTALRDRKSFMIGTLPQGKRAWTENSAEEKCKGKSPRKMKKKAEIYVAHLVY